MNHQNTATHLIGFYSSTDAFHPYHPGIVVTPKYDENGKYICSFHAKAFPDLEAVINRNNEELIKFLKSQGFSDIKFFPSNDWLGFKPVITSQGN